MYGLGLEMNVEMRQERRCAVCKMDFFRDMSPHESTITLMADGKYSVCCCCEKTVQDYKDKKYHKRWRAWRNRQKREAGR